jgi:mercuric ion transport protein
MSVKEGVTAARASRGPALLAAGGLVGALAASSCCILPLALFSIGVSGAWIGSFTRLAPYQPYFLAAALVSLGAGYRAVYRSSKRDCAGHGECAREFPNSLVKAALIGATALIVVALGFDFIAPLLFNT